MFNLQKRINRKTYWLGLSAYLVAMSLWVALIFILPLNDKKNFEPIYDIPLTIILLGITWYVICLTRQRANDISGTHPFVWMFLSFLLIYFVIGFIPGEKTTNRYGSLPSGFNLFS